MAASSDTASAGGQRRAAAPDASLVGRHRELAQVRAAVRLLVDGGAGSCLTVEGPPGIGKSRLVAVAVAEAGRHGLPVAGRAANELDRVAPLASLLGALRTSDPPVVERAAELGDPGAGPLWVVDRLGEMLQVYVQQRPLVVVLDDLQWADELSLFALRFLVPALASFPVLWLLSRRSSRATADDGERPDAWPAGSDCQRLSLGPLDDRAVREICTQELGARPDAALERLALGCGGNPFLLHELLAALHDQDRVAIVGRTAHARDEGSPFPTPPSLQRRLAEHPVEVRRLLEAASVLGRPFGLHEVARMLGRQPVELLPVAEGAMRADLLVDCGPGLAFRHDLIREAVYDGLAVAARQVLHQQAATVLHDDGRPPMEVAEHLMRSGRSGHSVAVDVIQQAVAQHRVTAPRTAAELVVRALDMLGPDDPARADLVCEGVRLLARVGRVEQARRLGEGALGGGTEPATESTLLLGLTEAVKHAGDDVAALDLSARGLARAQVPERTRAQLLAIRAHALLNAGTVEQAAEAAEAAVALGQASHSPAAQVSALAALSTVAQARGTVAEALDRARAAVELADEAGGEVRHLHPRLWLGHALAAADRFSEAASVYELGQREAERFETAWSHPLWHYYRAELLLASGLLDDSRAEAEAGARVADHLGATALSGPLLSIVAAAELEQGDLAAAAEALGRARRLGERGVQFRPEDLTWRRALVQHRRGQAVAALQTMSGWWSTLPTRRLLLVQEPSAGPRLVKIALAASAPELGRSVVDALSELAEHNRDVPSLVGAAAHARGVLHRDTGALQAAVTALRSSPRVLSRAEALEDLANTAQDRDPAAAVALLSEALEAYEAVGARPAGSRVRDVLTGLGVGPGSAGRDGDSGGLTPSEAKVASLVAGGLTNRQVARELFLSPHTVDSHLRHIFSKLEINSRVALTRWVLEQSEARRRRREAGSPSG